MLCDAGHEVFCIDRTVDLVADPARLGTRRHVVGQVESLPFLSCHFDVVTAAQTTIASRQDSRSPRSPGSSSPAATSRSRTTHATTQCLGLGV